MQYLFQYYIAQFAIAIAVNNNIYPHIWVPLYLWKDASYDVIGMLFSVHVMLLNCINVTKFMC